MIKLYLVSFLIFSSFSANAQNDFFILKKKDKTLKEYFTDAYINCELTNQQWVEGTIKIIRNDSVFIQTFHVNYLPTIWGTLTPDTLKEGTIKIPVKDIYAFPNKGNSPIDLLSKALQIGGAGYDALNIINSLSKKNTVFAGNNIGRLIGGAVAFVAGKILQWTEPSSLAVIGKKYHLEYMGSNTSSQ